MLFLVGNLEIIEELLPNHTGNTYICKIAIPAIRFDLIFQYWTLNVQVRVNWNYSTNTHMQVKGEEDEEHLTRIEVRSKCHL